MSVFDLVILALWIAFVLVVARTHAAPRYHSGLAR